MSTNKSDRIDSHRSIMRSTSIISLGTLSSRVLGFFRDVVLARLLGTGISADAFFVALKIPNLFRDMVGEGATNAAVVPVFSQYLEKKNRQAFWNFVSVVFTLALIVLSGITILGILFAPFIIRVFVPGFVVNQDGFLLAVRLTKIMFPYLILIGLTAYSSGLLYTFRSFAVPAFSPCLLNISIIASAFFASRTMKEPVFGLAIGVLVGGALQLLAQIKPLMKVGMTYKVPKSLYHPGAMKIGKLMVPRMLGSGVYQLTVLIDVFCASLSVIVGTGGISAIYYANRIIQFPMGIFSIALASVVLPTFSGQASRNDINALKKTLVFSLENIFFVMCPTTIILLLLASPIIRILFQRGEFSAYSTNITSWALTFYSLGLFSFGGIKILVTVFHSLQDTKTPVKIAAFCLCINAILNFILMGPLKIGGIALASSIAGTIDFFILFYLLEKKIGKLNSGLLEYFIKVILASSVVGLVEHWGWKYMPFSNDVIKLFFMIGFGYILFGFICFQMKIVQAVKFWGMVKGKIKF
ncbi:MAG: murein biosynthesis integral membrane protein MurJ [Candidatus Omnitrophica bacterium]|nr:murein biosynthesis integral membrane protein MurJ [Candidatus Omnitrophota bacterium]MBU4333074.1 murein biosynthesis integral membrane protein MurJ [Candidatus Omnitrophota bacterium]